MSKNGHRKQRGSNFQSSGYLVCSKGHAEKLSLSWMTGCHPKVNSNKAIDFMSKKYLFVLCSSVDSEKR
jgi:hypothetical protein